MTKPVLAVHNFSCQLATQGLPLTVSHNLSLQVGAGEVLAIVGESGSGKSVSFSRMFGLGECVSRSGQVYLQGEALHAMDATALAAFRGRNIGFVSQDPSAAFNPTMTLGKQLCEAAIAHALLTPTQAKAKALALLSECDLDNGTTIMGLYPHQLSGGMLQRVMIAMALMCDPQLLVADEPTTALDAVSAQTVLRLIRRLCDSRAMACILITHDFDVVAHTASHVGVMYAGNLLELAPVATIMSRPQHPYTQALQQCRPPRGQAASGAALRVIAGQPPMLSAVPSGCVFHPRCEAAMQICAEQAPPLCGGVRCWLAHCEATGLPHA